MANFCLPKLAADTFKSKLKDGSINLQKLSEMSSEERRDFFKEIVGDTNSRQVNTLFESKLLLKNQQQGMITWARTVAGLKPAVLRDMISRIQKLDKVLNPVDQRHFLEDLAAQKVGTHVSFEEAQKIADLAKQVSTAKAFMESGGDRLAYGKAKVDFGNYVSDLKDSNAPSLLEKIKSPGGLLNELAGTSKGLKASLDNSAIFRQGWKTMFTNPGIWAKNASQSFVDLVRQFGGKAVMDEVQADIQSRPNYDLMKKAKLDVGTTEEQFPSHLAEKIPLLGRVYKASEAAYTGFVYRTRADVFDKYINIAKTAGVDITDEAQLKPIGKLVNSLTGRGYLGEVGEKTASVANNVFFSPRFLKSNIDFLTAHQLQKGVTPFVRKQAAINLAKAVAGTASVLAIANALKPGSVETDPRSSNFGKIKVRGTTFDVSGGMASILVLGAKLATLSSKSSVTNKVTSLNSGKFGSQTGMDVVWNFTEGKFSPIAGAMRDYLKGQDFNGDKPTPLSTAYNLLTPLPIANAVKLYQSKDAPMLAGIIADALGISVNPPNLPKKK